MLFHCDGLFETRKTKQKGLVYGFFSFTRPLSLWYVGGCELNGFGVEIDCEHHMFVNMHQREIEKQIYLNFLNCMIFWGFKGIGLFGILVICWWGSRMLLWNMSWKGNMGLFCSEDPRYLVPANTINIREVSVSQCNCRYPSYWEGLLEKVRLWQEYQKSNKENKKTRKIF